MKMNTRINAGCAPKTQPKLRFENLKPCPQCRKPNHVEARICTCGFWLKAENSPADSYFPQLKREKYKKKIKNTIIVSGFVMAVGYAAAYFGGFVDFAAVLRDGGEENASAEKDVTSGGENDFGAPKGVIEGKVTTVLSGDAVTVSDKNGRRFEIRLGGVDAPDPGEDFGEQAKENLSNSVLDKIVEVYLQKIEADGRLVGKILLDGENINLAQIKNGAAKHHRDDAGEQSEADRRLYANAEIAAKNERIGLWSSTDLAAPPPITPNAAEDKNETLTKNEQVAPQKSKTEKAAENVSTADAAAASKIAESESTKLKTTELKPTNLKSAEPKTENTAVSGSIKKPFENAAAPKPARAPLTANARCADGTFSYRTSRSGSCAFHGGVSEWLDNSAESSKAIKKGSSKSAVIIYVRGPRGGCYFINASGARTYVARQMCD